MVLKPPRVGLEKKFFDLCLPIVEGLSLRIYDLDYIVGSQTLRLFISRRETIGAELDDCVRVDRALSEPFEACEWIPEQLTLEVSSPGIYRSLRNLDHFEEALSETVLIELKTKLESLLESSEVKSTTLNSLPKKVKSNKKVEVVLTQVDPDGLGIIVDIGEIKDYFLSFDVIKKATVEPELKF